MMIQGERICLRPASVDEQGHIYAMGCASDYPIFDYYLRQSDPFQAFLGDYDHRYFDEAYRDLACALMICQEEERIGFISYAALCYGETVFQPGIMELDIWMNGSAYAGKGLGTEAVLLLSDYLHEKRGIRCCFMLPEQKNLRARRSYRKAGLIEIEYEDKNDAMKRLIEEEFLASLPSTSGYCSPEYTLMIKTYDQASS